MILSNLFAFAVVVFAIWLNMALVKAILGIWMNDNRSTLAAFAFSVGTLTNLRMPAFLDDTMIGTCAGVLVAYVGLWWIHYGRTRREELHT